jgi:hypothetical protein
MYVTVAIAAALSSLALNTSTHQTRVQVLYPILLLDIARKDPNMHNVINSIVSSRAQLMSTVLLVLVITYNFTSFGFFFLLEHGFETECDEDSSLFFCVWNVLNHGMRNSGGVGDALEKSLVGDNKLSFGVDVFNFLFFVMICIFMLNIILGTIIDTFCELREQNERKATDKRNLCFICGKRIICSCGFICTHV